VYEVVETVANKTLAPPFTVSYTWYAVAALTAPHVNVAEDVVVSVTTAAAGIGRTGKMENVPDVIPMPAAFPALTWYVYIVPFIKPVNVYVVVGAVVVAARESPVPWFW
jgi:hypothetical protein